MAVQLKSLEELLELYIGVIQDQAPDLTDIVEGSKLDTIGGVLSMAATEIQALIVSEFRKTFFSTAGGPEVTGGEDDLQTLAVDHFGELFKRPGATKAIGIVTFSRPNTGAGDVTILAGAVVTTKPNPSGVVYRFKTLLDVTLTGLSINASVEALTAGRESNAEPGDIELLETALTDPSITVTNSDAFAGGAPAQDDATYRETIRNLIEALRGATIAAIEAKAKTVAGVVTATFIETEIPVIEFDISTGAIKSGAAYFRIPRSTLYIADANGSANAALIAAVKAVLPLERAAGVKIGVLGATAVNVDWTAAFTLNPGGPSFAELSVDPTKITDAMAAYINALPVGTGFLARHCQCRYPCAVRPRWHKRPYGLLPRPYPRETSQPPQPRSLWQAR
jgi:hypothetical protein